MTKQEAPKTVFEENAAAENAVSMARCMKDHFAFYGIPFPQRKEPTRPFIKAEKAQKAVDWAFLDECYAEEHREFQYFVNDCLGTMGRYLSYEDIPRILRYVKTKPWWDTVDFLDHILGDIGLRDARVNARMLEWSRDFLSRYRDRMSRLSIREAEKYL